MTYFVDLNFSNFNFNEYGNFCLLKKEEYETLDKALEQAKINEELSLDSLVFISEAEAKLNNLEILSGDEFEILKKLKLVYVEKEKGIETMGGMDFIYKKVVSSFLSSTKEYYDEIINKFNDSIDAYLLFTHSLKGISLNLGSLILYTVTMHGMKEEYYKKSSFLSFYNEVFKHVYDELEKYSKGN